jgi:type II secretion system protein L
MSVLFARLPGTPMGDDWFIARSENEVEPVSREALSDVVADRVVLLVPGPDVFMSTVTAATRSMADLRTAALFQLEDDLSQPVSEVHIAIGPRAPENPNTRTVAVVSDDGMSDWLNACEDLPAELLARAELIPETSLFTEGEPFVFDGDGRVIIYDGERFHGCDPHLAADLVPAILQQADLQSVQHIVSDDSQMTDVPGETSRVDSFVAFIAPNLLAGAGIDLRQGAYARRSQGQFKLSGWSATLGLAAAALLIWITSLGVSVFGLNQASDDLYNSMVTAYSRAFPEEGRVVDPSREVALKMRNAPGGSGASFIELSAALYAGLEEVEGVSLQGLTFDRTSGQITASLQFAGYESRDRLRDSFERRALSLELGGARQEAGVIVGEASFGGRP